MACALGLAACGSGGGESAGSGNGDPNPPTAGTVADGVGEDIDQQTSTTTIAANWTGFVDAEGPIATYHWAIGVTPGGTEVQDWADVGAATAATNAQLVLGVGTTYYVAVRALDLAGNVSTPAVSDGVLIVEEGGNGGGNGGGGGSQTLASSVTQFGITWTFAQSHPVGQFANGDWWVVGPVDVTRISPQTTTVNGRVIHGSMINPIPNQGEHGYDSTLYGQYHNNRYIPSLNVATGVSASRPLRLAGGTSLISAISQMEPDPGSTSQLRTAAVLTVLATAPPAGSFRPAYAGTDKTVRFQESQLDWGRLARLAPVAGTPSIGSVANLFQRVWLDHCPGWTSRMMHPVLNMKDYGRDFSSDIGSAALLVNMNYTQAQKRDLVVRLVQLGIDWWGNVSNGCRWYGEGGQGSGRKFPILFAGAMLNDATMLAIGQTHPSRYLGPSGNNTSWFGEDCQTFYVQETSPGVFNWGFGGYNSSHRGLPEWGGAHTHFPANDRASWTEDAYRRCCTANAWVGYILAARVMGLIPAWNNNALFDYQDRYMQIEARNTWTRSWQTWHEVAWDTYRPQL